MMRMMIMMMSFLYSALADQSLECYNDYFNTVTCVWNSSKLNLRPETHCLLHVTVTKARSKTTMEEQMMAEPSRPHIRTATVVFSSKYGMIKPTAELSEEVRCENYTNPLATISKHFGYTSVVKLAPPRILEVRGLNVSWSFIFSKYCVFEVQCRSAAQSWTDVSVRETRGTLLQLSEDELLFQHQHMIRVRGKHSELINAIWSDWSEEYSWISEVGRMPTTAPTPDVSGILGLELTITGFVLTVIPMVALVCVILICCNRNKRLQKSQSFSIPDPSKFFGDLNSYHGGNFTSWLGPILSYESFIKVNTEFVSPVEVLKCQDGCESRSTNRHSGGLQDGWEGTNKSSNFSNSTYFLSQSSKGPVDTLEPCSPHSSYGPAGGVIGPEPVLQRDAEEKDGGTELEFSLKTLEKLRQDTQSPDSGFAGGAEDSIEEAELPSPPALNLPPHLHLPAPHAITHPLLGFKHTPVLSLIELDLQSSCGMIEPSSDDYMPVKNVQN
ncbi:interleukin-2 receptor subunit beta [Pseudorasbora parva]|uniref:interleukin-2 receptor subunit beta n=1 Tax=Pseudorasbora parva TaxID=51549 RepID=UPI00351EC95D